MFHCVKVIFGSGGTLPVKWNETFKTYQVVIEQGLNYILDFEPLWCHSFKFNCVLTLNFQLSKQLAGSNVCN